MRRSPYAKNKTELSQRIPCNRSTLDQLFKRPDHPKNHGEGVNKYDVALWQKFAAENTSAHNKLAGQSNGNGTYPLNEREQSIVRKNNAVADRENFRMERERGLWLPKDGTKQFLQTQNAITLRELMKLKEVLPPRFEGLPAAAMRKMLDTALRKALENLPVIK